MKKEGTRTLHDILHAFPPNIVRLLARKGRGRGVVRLTHEEVSKESGLCYEKVRDLSSRRSWDDVTIAEADAFMRGCGVSIGTLWRQRAFLKRSLNPLHTSEPLAFASRRGRATAPPLPAELVAAALSRSRRRASA